MVRQEEKHEDDKDECDENQKIKNPLPLFGQNQTVKGKVSGKEEVCVRNDFL